MPLPRLKLLQRFLEKNKFWLTLFRVSLINFQAQNCRCSICSDSLQRSSALSFSPQSIQLVNNEGKLKKQCSLPRWKDQVQSSRAKWSVRRRRGSLSVCLSSAGFNRSVTDLCISIELLFPLLWFLCEIYKCVKTKESGLKLARTRRQWLWME